MALTRVGSWSVGRSFSLIALAAAFACGDDAVSEGPPAQSAPDAGAPPVAADDAGAPSTAVDLTGSWLATLGVPPMSIRLILNFERGADGEWTGTVDSPDQGGIGIPITSVTVTGRHVAVRLDVIGLDIAGDVSEDGQTLTGAIGQAGANVPVVFEKQPGPVDYRRPQDPVAPFPYDSVEVTFPSEDPGVTLAGTLISPRGAGPFTTVVLLTGSGQQNRNEELANHRPFLVLADALARANLAVLRFDDRGIGGSSGDFAAATSLNFAADARGAVDYLRSQTQVPVGSIGLVGHSEGGIVGPLAADGNAEVRFLVLLAGPGVDGETTILSQSRAIAAAQGATPAELDADEAQQRAVYACYRTPGAVEADAGTDAGALADAGEVSEADLDTCLRRELAAAGLSDADMAPLLAELESPWRRFFVTYDPVPVLQRSQVPVLALNGSLDLQVLADVNLPPIRAALEEAGNPSSLVTELPGLNHLFQHATTGAPDEYGTITETMSPDVPAQIIEWIEGLPAAP
jgi:pimeloyl-ACP methyl ester carboxylesterase